MSTRNMHPIEEEIISLIEKDSYISIECRRKLYALPLGKLSQEFYTDIRVTTYCTSKKGRILNFRVALEEYIASDHSLQHLENIEAAILQLPSPMSSSFGSEGSNGLQNKAAGTYLMPLSSELIRQVYLLQDANMPYKPKCTLELSERIMAAAKKITAFSTVRHITSEKAIQSIFDDALYGRRTLIDFYLRFDPAALHASDVLNGDGNVVCLGPQDIDPMARGGIIIEFDLTKLIQNKPSAFYKQRDLEYQVNSN